MTTKATIRPVKHFCVGDISHQIKPQEGYEFLETTTYHGDRDEIWIEVYDKEGKLTNRWNCRFVIGIQYA